MEYARLIRISSSVGDLFQSWLFHAIASLSFNIKAISYFIFLYFRHPIYAIMTTIESASVKKLISDLAAEGFLFHIDFDEINEYRFGKICGKRKLENVVFEKDGIILKIHNDLFFRITGLSHLFDEILQKPVKVSDYEFYEMQKHLIRYRYDQRIKHLKASGCEMPTDFTIST